MSLSDVVQSRRWAVFDQNVRGGSVSQGQAYVNDNTEVTQQLVQMYVDGQTGFHNARRAKSHLRSDEITARYPRAGGRRTEQQSA